MTEPDAEVRTGPATISTAIALSTHYHGLVNTGMPVELAADLTRIAAGKFEGLIISDQSAVMA
jgi:hypothetical protein